MHRSSRAPGRRIGVLLGLAALTATSLALLAPSAPSTAATTSVTTTGTDPSGTLWTSTEASVDVASYPATHTIELPQFDTTLGVLTEVDLDGWVSGTVDGSLKNLSTTQVKYLTPYIDANISVHGPLVGTDANAHAATPLVLQPQETQTYHLENTGTFHATSTSADVLTQFLGTGTVQYPVDTNVETSVEGPAPYDSGGVAHGAAAVKVTYHYQPPAPPPPPVTQTESIYVYQCDNGATTSTAVSGATVGDAGAQISATTPAPVVDVDVAAGPHTTTATVPTGWQFVACGQTGVTTTDDQDATQSGDVPSSGHTDFYYYAQPVPSDCSGAGGTSGSCPPPPPPVEPGTGSGTAWAADPVNGGKYNPDGGGNWATYVGGPSGTWSIYAGQFNYSGTVTISATGQVSVDLGNGASFAGGSANLQIQGYDAPPSGNPSPGHFATQVTCSGTTCSATVPPANYYGIHLGVTFSGGGSQTTAAPLSTAVRSAQTTQTAHTGHTATVSSTPQSPKASQPRRSKQRRAKSTKAAKHGVRAPKTKRH